MKKISLMALLFGAALFIGLGTSSALAEEGSGAEKKEMTPAKCSGEKKAVTPGKCSGEKKAVTPGKCSGEKKEKEGKCNTGK